ncbi:MAG TPA: TusE/DsrC/DsvC family sulfur relay protein [Burkholderiaceae bacterium]|nr:TusE/DsrC/DsvC family sulfur relay protein [Burkholderiaceae bacterium]
MKPNTAPTDDEGYLLDPLDWSESFARTVATKENIELTEDHWDVIRFMRDFYQTRQVAADARFVIKHLSQRYGTDARNRLFELFPYGYVKQACKIAGMKRPRAWSTG